MYDECVCKMPCRQLLAPPKTPPQPIATAAAHRADAQHGRADHRSAEQNAGGQCHHKFQRRFHRAALRQAGPDAKQDIATPVSFPVKRPA